MSTAQVYWEQAEESLANADKLWHLQQTELAHGLSFLDLNRLAGHAMDRIYPQDEILFRPGERADSLFIVNRGTVRLSLGNATGREKILGIFKTGEIFGEEVLAPDPIRRSLAVAHEECWVSVLAGEHLWKLLDQVPSLHINLLRILYRKLLEAREEIEALSFDTTQQRIARILLKLARGHGRELALRQGMVKLTIPVSHEQMAQLVGANRPHVSKIMSEFKKRGWIDYSKRKLLVHLPQLAALVSD